MQIDNNTVVTLHYSVSSSDGTEIDNSRSGSGEPLVFLQGSHYLIEGLENALQGKQAGDKFAIEVEPEQGYGDRHEQLVQAVPKSMFEGAELEVGMSFRATTDDGEQSVIIIDMTDDEVIVDGNHPLAGIDLSFDVEVIDVRAASEEEIAHGHVHGAGGCVH